VTLVGIGFIALLTGALADRFLHPEVRAIEQATEELEATADDVAVELVRIPGRAPSPGQAFLTINP
jgi:hypothetical protein